MVIEAAGGLLWRPADRGVEIALVHRPKYDDWSLPKGKLEPDEHRLLAAVREIEEETGATSRPGQPLGQLRYNANGPKRVRYWDMQWRRGDFARNDEVDEVRWLPPRAARRMLNPQRDARILERRMRDPRPTWPVVIVRHASAGERGSVKDDDERPLDELGLGQAARLAPIFAAYAPEQVLTAHVTRCLQTVEPFAAMSGVPVDIDSTLSEQGHRDDAEKSELRLLEAAASGRPLVICTQRPVLGGLLRAACAGMDGRLPPDTATRKGGWWTLHLAWGMDRVPDLVALERFEPPATGRGR